MQYFAIMSDPLQWYKRLQNNFQKDVSRPENLTLISECAGASMDELRSLQTKELKSLVPDKSYFEFVKDKKASRAVNSALFSSDLSGWHTFIKALQEKTLNQLTPEAITSAIYSVAMSFCCYVDLTKIGDQKTPGTFFEYLIGHLFSRHLGVNPTNKLQVLNLDDNSTTLPTDFVFSLGKNKPRFHLPVKTSTRERVIQVWAHQRVLDGVYGTGRFLGTPVILAETKTDKRKKEVIEICLPDQWRIYQMHIAQLKRIYYLDVPVSYDKLNDVFPPLNVKSFGHFFFELDDLIS